MNSETIFLGALALLAHSVVGLVAIWVGLGRGHWFLRVAVLGGVLALGLAIPSFELLPAYELVLLFLTQSVIVIVPLLVVRYVRARRAQGKPYASAGRAGLARLRPQFSLLDLLLGTVVVAAALAFATQVPWGIWGIYSVLWWEVFPPFTPEPPDWVFAGLVPAVLALSTLVAAWAGLGRGLRWVRLTVLLLIPLAWLMAAWLALLRASGWLRSERPRDERPAAESGEAKTRSRAASRFAKVGVVLLSLLMLYPLGTVYIVLVRPVPIPDTALPDPNAYDALVWAGHSLAWLHYPDHPDAATDEEPEGPRKTRGEYLEAARAALELECRVAFKYTVWDISDAHDGRATGAFSELGRAFRDEGASAHKEGRTADAVRNYLDAIRLARASVRGGTIIDAIVGCVIEDFGLEGLCGVRDALTPEQARELIAELNRLDANREPLSEVFYRDDMWEEQLLGWPGKLLHLFERKTGKLDVGKHNAENAVRRVQAVMRLLICDLAVRVYRAERGRNPERLTDLVPEYLSAVPEDPFSEEPLIYRRTPTGYMLYSVGHNRRDDGGRKPPPTDWRGGDIVLD
ncbi:MAG: hypothetical protein ACYTG0_32650 [Planctomycetota bacterium]